VLITSPHCSSGSDRIASLVSELANLAWAGDASAADPATAAAKLSSTAVINVQGDQPFIDPAVITAAAAACTQRDPTSAVITPVYRLQPEHIHNPAVVKTVLSADGRALFISRSAITHVRGIDPAQCHAHTTFWDHVGLYAYRAHVCPVAAMGPFPLEQMESLEQLHLIEAGHTVATREVPGTSLSVDTAEQLEQARAIAAREDPTIPMPAQSR